MRAFLLVLIIQIAIESFGCDCKSITKLKEYNTSEFIFVGEVTSKSDAGFELVVYERFKGKVSDTIQFIIADCSIFPRKSEIWLIYANKYDSSFLHASQCGWSRSINRPFSGNSVFFPKPPPPELSDEILEVLTQLHTNLALQELYSDIEYLRHVKALEEMENINLSISNLTSMHDKIYDNQKSLFIWLAIPIFIMLLAVLILLIYCRK